ncbi:mitochondrial thiamine pyrophosphate transporter [Borealophlyctis nickersoniae]|nr:mitochondrial thiamine pyrophosphate transporter [Borealophlyctis nickersoniae]
MHTTVHSTHPQQQPALNAVEKQQTVTSLQSAVCGATAGLISRFFIAPLDIVKIRFQLQSDARRGLTHTDGKYRGIMQSMKLIVQEEGIKGLWKGNWSAEYLYLTYGAVQFYTYHESERALNALNERLSHKLPKDMQTFLAGSIAGCTATLVTFPFDLLRTRFAAQGEPKVYTGIIPAIRLIAAKEGIGGFYRGVWPSAASIVPQMGIVFASNEAFKRVLRRAADKYLSPNSRARLKGMDDFIAGGLAGVAGKTAIMPLDVIRKRLQVQGPDRNSYAVGDVPRYTNVANCVKQIVRHEGVLALYKGLLPALLKAAPSSAITFFVYERCREGFRAINDGDGVTKRQ